MNLLLPQNSVFESSSLVIGVLNGLAEGYLASLFWNKTPVSTLLAFLIRRRSGFILWCVGLLVRTHTNQTTTDDDWCAHANQPNNGRRAKNAFLSATSVSAKSMDGFSVVGLLPRLGNANGYDCSESEQCQRGCEDREFANGFHQAADRSRTSNRQRPK